MLQLGTMIFDDVSIQIEEGAITDTKGANTGYKVLVVSNKDNIWKNIFLNRVELLTLINDLIKSSELNKLHPKLRCLIKGF